MMIEIATKEQKSSGSINSPPAEIKSNTQLTPNFER
jgi:hypothetical protein